MANVVLHFWIQPVESGEKIYSTVEAVLDGLSDNEAEEYLLEHRGIDESPIRELMDKYNLSSNADFGITKVQTEDHHEEGSVVLEGNSVTKKSLLDYLLFIGFSMTGVGKDLIFNYEEERCRLHQVLFAQASQDRIKNRDSAFCKALDDIICHSLCCPYCKVSMGRNSVCIHCDHKLKKSDIHTYIEDL